MFFEMLVICRKMTTFIQKPANMLKKLPKEPQLEIFKTVLTGFIHPQHELCLLAKKIDWKSLEDEFAPLYGKVGRPSIPTRTIVGLLLLKPMYKLGDETVVQHWLENPYWSRVLGTERFIFNKGRKTIFKQSIDLFEEDFHRKEIKEVRIDTKVQEKNITFPTDRKLYEKTIEYCKRIAKAEDIKLKRNYTREIRKLKHQFRFAKGPQEL